GKRLDHVVGDDDRTLGVVPGERLPVATAIGLARRHRRAVEARANRQSLIGQVLEPLVDGDLIPLAVGIRLDREELIALVDARDRPGVALERNDVAGGVARRAFELPLSIRQIDAHAVDRHAARRERPRRRFGAAIRLLKLERLFALGLALELVEYDFF